MLLMKTALEVYQEAVALHAPIRAFVGFSGGRDSLAVTHWMMAHVPDCEAVHINTGIGVERTREFVRETCRQYRWPLHEIRALEDCGQDYDELVRRYGFPGPPGHRMMYARLKERAIRVLVQRRKTKRTDRILIATGIRREESVRRMAYAGREVNRTGAQVWINPLYWWEKLDRDMYLHEHQLPVNPVSEALGMSGECLCGAFAHPGELDMVRKVCPATAQRIDRLHAEIAHRFPWGWEGRPPSKKAVKPSGPFCVGCEKSAIVKKELLEIPTHIL